MIDKLRFFNVLRRHLGDADAQETADALQDEFAEIATHEDIDNLKLWFRAEISGAVNKVLFGAGVIAGIALAIAELI